VILSVPSGTPVSGGNVRLTENGQNVYGAVITRVSNAASGDFGVVLAIDTSASMKGKSINSAIAAARAIAAQRTGQQQLGVITFNQTPSVLLPLTSNQAEIDSALSRTPTTGGHTAIYDALSAAIEQLQAAHIAAGAVILLSDGDDYGSTISEHGVAAEARAAHISLDTVGIRNRYFDPSSLSALARDGGGDFQAAQSSQLTRVFTSLLGRLEQQYVVHFRSLALPGTNAKLSVEVSGLGTADLSYEAPSAPGALVVNRPKPKSFWVSSTALVVVGVGAALLCALAFVILFVPRRRRSALRRRIGEFTAQMPPVAAAEVVEFASDRKRSPFAVLELLLEGMRWWPRFKENVEIAGFSRQPVDLVAITLAATLLVAIGVGIASGLPVLSLIALPLGPLALHALVRNRLHRQRELFRDQLGAHLEELASAMRAGHGLVSGLAAMVRSASEPSKGEWNRVLADEQLGKPLEVAMQSLARRMDCDEVEQMALVASLHQRTGGNMAEVLDRVADGVRERAELRRELQALTSQARLSRWVVTALPPAVATVVMIVNPHYLRPLFHTTGGNIMLVIAVVLLILGSLVMRALTDIKV
jgi:tight adherence protein B